MTSVLSACIPSGVSVSSISTITPSCVPVAQQEVDWLERKFPIP